jgi:hypothetical protein
MQQGVDQGARLEASPWMNDHPGPFIDDQDILILEQNLQRYFFRANVDGRRFRFNDRDAITGTNRLSRAADLAIDQDVAALDQILNPRSRKAV